MNYKKIFLIILAITINFSLVANTSAIAGIGNFLGAKAKAQNSNDGSAAKGICLRIDDISSNTDQRLTQKEEQLENQIQNRLQERDKNREQNEEDLAAFREKADAWREQSYQKIEEKAQTEEQEVVLKKFKTTIETAVEARRGAVDDAIDAFREGVDQAKADHKTDIKAVISEFHAKVNTAFQKAKDDCESGAVNEKTIRANLRTSLQAAKGSLKEDRNGVSKLQTTMQTLIDAKKAAFEKAIMDFKATMKNATSELKKSFPEADIGNNNEESNT